MTFEEWYAQRDWWKDQHDELQEQWNALLAERVAPEKIAQVFDVLVNVMSDEYGE